MFIFEIIIVVIIIIIIYYYKIFVVIIIFSIIVCYYYYILLLLYYCILNIYYSVYFTVHFTVYCSVLFKLWSLQKKNESTALNIYTKYYNSLRNTNMVVCRAGYVVCEEHPFLVASSDAYVYDLQSNIQYGLAEIKCLIL